MRALMLAVLAAAGCARSDPDNAATRKAQGLQQDMKKAEAAAAAANASLQQTSRSVDDALQE